MRVGGDTVGDTDEGGDEEEKLDDEGAAGEGGERGEGLEGGHFDKCLITEQSLIGYHIGYQIIVLKLSPLILPTCLKSQGVSWEDAFRKPKTMHLVDLLPAVEWSMNFC